VVAPKISVDALVEALEPRFGCVRELDEPQGLDQLVLLLLARDASFKRARSALRRLQQDYVDWNDVRVTPAYEIAGKIEAVGAQTALRKAGELLDLLSTLYLRFNKMSVEGAPSPEAPPDEVKRRARLLAFLAEKAALYGALMPMHGAKEDDVLPSPELTRVLARLGLVDAKANDAAAREALLKKSKPGERIALQFVLHQLALRMCVHKTPLCGECPVSERCPSAKVDEAADDAKSAKKKASGEKKKPPARPKAR